MVQHGDIDHTGITGVGGSVATDAIWDAAGDLAVGTGANTAARLAVGAARARLASNGTTAEWVGDVFVIASHSTTQSITTATFTRPVMDTDTSDTGAIHFTSDANLTGTVTKTASSTAITGSGTSFTTELAVGQIISIPGTAAELGAVASITNNTSLTLYQTMANSASGQTATRVSGGVYAPRAGIGNVTLYVEWDANSTGERAGFLSILPASGGVSAAAGVRFQSPPTGNDSRLVVPLTHRFVLGDVISTSVRQQSGGNLLVNAVRLTLTMP